MVKGELCFPFIIQTFFLYTTTEEEELEKECSKTDDVITDDDVQDKNELSDETPIQDEKQVEVVVDKEYVKKG